MKLIGFARISADEQTLDLQRHALEATGCTVLRSDSGVSGAARKRPGLDQALSDLKPADVLVVPP